MTRQTRVIWHAECPNSDIEMTLEDDRMPHAEVLRFWGTDLHKAHRPRFSTVLVYTGNRIYTAANWSTI